jgi:DUF917 family protein
VVLSLTAAIDGDWMGRAYPTKWQTTPVVFNERPCVFCPIATADGNGNLLYMPTAVSDLAVERIIRAALSQMGMFYSNHMSAVLENYTDIMQALTLAAQKDQSLEQKPNAGP